MARIIIFNNDTNVALDVVKKVTKPLQNHYKNITGILNFLKLLNK